MLDVIKCFIVRPIFIATIDPNNIVIYGTVALLIAVTGTRRGACFH